MKMISCVLSGFVLSALACGAASAEDLQFRLINNSGYDVVEFQVSDPGDEDWSDDLMPEGHVLPDGNYVDVVIADGADYCEYDLKVVWDDEDEYVEYASDICDLGEWELTR